MQLARLGLLPTQAKRAVHDGRRRNWKLCHWSWNVKSTIREAELSQHKPGSPWAHCLQASQTLSSCSYGCHFAKGIHAYKTWCNPVPWGFRCILVWGQAAKTAQSQQEAPCCQLYNMMNLLPAFLQLDCVFPYCCYHVILDLPLQLQMWRPAIGKTRVASNTSKASSAWWPASKLKIVPLAMGCQRQIDNQRSRASPTQTWIALGTLSTGILDPF